MTIVNTDYGVFAKIVAVSGTILAAGSAIGLGWRRRAKWEPIEQDVPAGPQKVGSLVSAVSIALLFAFLNDLKYARTLGTTAAWCLGGTIVALVVYTLLFSIVYEKEAIAAGAQPPKTVRVKVIGGTWLTPVARAKLGFDGAETIQDLYDGAAYNKDRVWPKIAQQLAQALFILAYLGLVCAGTIALACASILVALRIKGAT
jgi:hypothetical protein